MSLERKDVRCKLRPDIHAAIIVLAEVDQLDIGEWVEREVERVVLARVHAAKVVAERCGRLGISGTAWESAGIAGNRRDCPGTSGSGRE